MVASENEHPEEPRSVRRNPNRRARGNSQTRPANTGIPTDASTEAQGVSEIASSRDSLASRPNADDADIAVSLPQDLDEIEDKEDQRPSMEAHTEATWNSPAPFVTDRAYSARERELYTTIHGRGPRVLTLGERLNLLRPYNIARYSGSQKEHGRFEFFYGRLCKRVKDSCGSLAMMDEILLHHLSDDLRQRVDDHLGARRIPDDQMLDYILGYLRKTFDNQTEIELRLHESFMSMQQGPKESVATFELRWDALISQMATTRLWLSETWLHLWICQSFRSDIAAKVSSRTPSSQADLWSTAKEHEKELTYSQPSTRGFIPPTGQVRSRKRVPAGRSSNSSPRN